MSAATTLVTGNTYPVKDQLKAMGARWDAVSKGWRVPVDKAAEAQALVARAPASPGPRKSGYDGKTCRACGTRERRNSRGYVDGDRVWGGYCQSCREEHAMGY